MLQPAPLLEGCRRPGRQHDRNAVERLGHAIEADGACMASQRAAHADGNAEEGDALVGRRRVWEETSKRASSCPVTMRGEHLEPRSSMKCCTAREYGVRAGAVLANLDVVNLPG